MIAKVNGKSFEADVVFFDGCHKFYIPDTKKGYECMFEHGWDEEMMFPIEDLPSLWAGSCPLRFIQSADLERQYVAQGEPAVFEGWDLDPVILRELAEMETEDWII